MSQSHGIYLYDRHMRTYVEASLVEGAGIDAGIRADAAWAQMLTASVVNGPEVRVTPEHAHWEWAKKIECVQGLLPYTTFSVECAGAVQGLMIVRTSGDVALLPQKRALPLVYIAYLATAPWNWAPYSPTPRFRGVGQAMLLGAINLSLELDFKGRIGLHSLPQSESWYVEQGMTKLGDSAKKGNLTYYEMSEESARQFVGQE